MATTPLPELGGFLKTMEELKGMVAGMVEEKRKGAPGEALAAQGKRCVLKMAEVRKANRDAHEAADESITAAEAERHETDIVSQQVCCLFHVAQSSPLQWGLCFGCAHVLTVPSLAHTCHRALPVAKPAVPKGPSLARAANVPLVQRL